MRFSCQPLKLKIAYIISRIFDPVLLLLPLGIIVMSSGHLDGRNRLAWALVLILFLAVLPIITVIIMIKKKKFTLEMERKEDRTPFFITILFFWLIGLILSWSLSGPRLIIGLIAGAMIIVTLMTIINFYTKISGHSMMITAGGFLINLLYGWNYWWLFLFVPIVAWSRYVLKLHTIGQLIGGCCLGGLVLIAMKFFGY